MSYDYKTAAFRLTIDKKLWPDVSAEQERENLEAFGRTAAAAALREAAENHETYDTQRAEEAKRCGFHIADWLRARADEIERPC